MKFDDRNLGRRSEQSHESVSHTICGAFAGRSDAFNMAASSLALAVPGVSDCTISGARGRCILVGRVASLDADE